MATVTVNWFKGKTHCCLIMSIIFDRGSGTCYMNTTAGVMSTMAVDLSSSGGNLSCHEHAGVLLDPTTRKGKLSDAHHWRYLSC